MAPKDTVRQFQRRRKTPKQRSPAKQKGPKRRIGGLYDHIVGNWYWPHGLRTWMLITIAGPMTALGIAWLLGWRTAWL